MAKSATAKKVLVFSLVVAVICLVFAGIAICSGSSENSGTTKNGTENAVTTGNTEKAAVTPYSAVISLQIGNPEMTVNGENREIDPGRDTAPLIVSERTLVPIRAIIEAVGGTVGWDDASRTVTLTYKSDAIRLVIDSTEAYLNDTASTLDVAPAIISERTMLPIRFIAESFKFTVEWTEETKTFTINVPADESTAPSVPTDDASPDVFMTTEITPEALVAIYSKLGFDAEGNVAVKMSTGEPPNSNYLRPELIKNLIQSVDGTIVECNTAYGGQRSLTELHKQVARDHGFYDIADVDIMDEDGYMSIPIAKGTTITEDFVGKNLEKYDSLISLAHFKGHAMAGYGGAIKNMSIGVASKEGKSWIHSGGTSMTSPWGGKQDAFCEAMADATSGVVDFFDGKVVYINVMNRISIDCDCDGNPAEPDLHDIGILASTDPVALDQACIDLVYAQKDGDGASLVSRIESRNGLHTLEHAAEIGLGSRTYNLVSIDE